MSSKMYVQHPEVLWRPKEEGGSQTEQFMDRVRKKYKVKLNDYWDLHKWSVENIPEFWAEMWDFSQVIYSKTYDKVVDRDVKCEDMPTWFEGARLNYAENLLKYRDDHTALIIAGEERLPKYVSFAKLYEESCLYGAALRKFGIKKGDCVTCYMSCREEPIYAMLGAASIGASWTGALPLLGAQAVLNRFKLTHPRIMFTLDRFSNDGEEKDMLEKVKEIANEVPSLEKVVIVPSTPESRLKDISGIRNSCFLEEFLELGRNEDGSVPPLEFEQLPFDHPVFISYTSGTTGPPKVLVHGMGVILTAYRDFGIHMNFSREDVYLSMSPVGWASWSILTTLLELGVATVIFEGVPYYSTPTNLWDMVDEFKISNLFLTPNVIDELEKRNYLPTPKHHLTSLHTILSGSSVVKPKNYEFVYRKIKAGVRFGSYYGCTEIMGSSLVFDATVPIHKGEVSVPALGNDTKCFNDSGQPVFEEVGELVLVTPTPSLPVGLLGDDDGTEFKKRYCSLFPGHFTPGDLGIINPVTKGFIIYGRSDDTLKPKGARFGSVEIYNIETTEFLHGLVFSSDLPLSVHLHKSMPFRNLFIVPNPELAPRRQTLMEEFLPSSAQMAEFESDRKIIATLKFDGFNTFHMSHGNRLIGTNGKKAYQRELWQATSIEGEVDSTTVETFEDVFDCLCVSQYNKDRDERAVLFVKMKDGYEFNEDLVKRLRLAIENGLTKRHVPEVILETSEIPRNLNGKKMEILVKKIINKMPCNIDSVINPESLDYYRNIPQLRGF